MYDEFVDFLNLWGKDIHTISINHYEDGISEVLINDCYLYIIKDTSNC